MEQSNRFCNAVLITRKGFLDDEGRKGKHENNIDEKYEKAFDVLKNDNEQSDHE